MTNNANKYTFGTDPRTHQPTGYCDFSKIYNPNTAIMTCTNMDTRKTEQYVVTRTEHANGVKYVWAPKK